MKNNNLSRNSYLFSKHCFIFLFISLFLSAPFTSYGRLRNFETSRMKSTGGAGVGSLLLDEATLLNPASLGFYTVSSLYFQKGSMEFSPIASNTNYKGITPETVAIIASDASQTAGGSLSYTKQNEHFDSRKRLSVSIASPISKNVAAGLTFTNSTDIISLTKDGYNYFEDSYSQLTFGITHPLNQDFTIGLVAIDPFQVKPEQTRGIIGFQYVYKAISFILDIGSNYNEDLSNYAVYKGALQFNVFNDFFLRFGVFSDRGLREKGNGIGAGWAGPKLVLDLAVKNTQIESIPRLKIVSEQLRESSLSLSYKF